METKICPNCGAEVVSIANLCKHCFHDFTVKPVVRKSPVFPLLLLALATSLVAAGVYSWQASLIHVSRIVVDNETQTIVFATAYPGKIDADRVKFADVASIEYLKHATKFPYQIDVVTRSGERFVYDQSDRQLDYAVASLEKTLNLRAVTKDAAEGTNP